MDERTGLTPEAVKELRRVTDLALRATKHTAHAVGRSMAGSIAAERHLWLNLTEIREKEKVFLLDAPISKSGLFGEAVSSVVGKFRPRQNSRHFSVQCFTLHHPKQGRQGLSFVVEDVTPPRPSRHPKSGMSSSARHSASSIAFLSRMGASTRGIALGSPHSSVRLHTSVWAKSPPQFSWP